MSFHFIFVANFIRDKNPLYGSAVINILVTALLESVEVYVSLKNRPYVHIVEI